jgi:hypothetical protein
LRSRSKPLPARNQPQTIGIILTNNNNNNNNNNKYYKEYMEMVDLPMMELTSKATTTTTSTITSTTNNKNKSGNSDLCFFAGVGFDSLLLQDFKTVRKWSFATGILNKPLSSVLGYCVALVALTLPKCVTRNEHLVQVQLSTCMPKDCVWVDHRRGDVVRPILQPQPQQPQQQEDSTILYKGTAGIVAAGTCPYYGGGLRLFPFARMTTDKLHLRVGRIPPLQGFWNIPSIFKGSFRDTSPDKFQCLDFIGTDFEIEILGDQLEKKKGSLEEEEEEEEEDSSSTSSTSSGASFPLQHSGESVGSVEKFRLRVLPQKVRLGTRPNLR